MLYIELDSEEKLINAAFAAGAFSERLLVGQRLEMTGMYNEQTLMDACKIRPLHHVTAVEAWEQVPAHLETVEEAKNVLLDLLAIRDRIRNELETDTLISDQKTAEEGE